ncbi:MAG TPA: HD domain-containing protein [Longimicrobiales bacterium]|nr:HD domain-containing protein [Longimicrobiales bacterium]
MASGAETPAGVAGALGEVLRAALFAAEKHRAGKRKDADASPYINHPLQVAAVLAEHGVTDPVTLRAALLHDTLEDTATTPAQLEEAFGQEVTRVVLEMTDDSELPKAERKRLQVEHSSELSERAKLVKLGDKICNVTDVGWNPPRDWSLSRRVEYLDWTASVVEGCRGTHAALEDRYDRVLAAARKELEGGGEG